MGQKSIISNHIRLRCTAEGSYPPYPLCEAERRKNPILDSLSWLYKHSLGHSSTCLSAVSLFSGMLLSPFGISFFVIIRIGFWMMIFFLMYSSLYKRNAKKLRCYRHVAQYGPPRCPAEPRQGFHHHFPATKNGSRKKMTACRDVPWRVSYGALPTRLSKSCIRDLVQKNFGGMSND